MRRASELERLERHLAALGEVAIEGLLLVSRDGVIERANPAAEAMLGYETGGLAGVQMSAILAGGEPEAEALLSGPGRSDTHCVTRSGEPVAVVVRLAAVGDESGAFAVAALELTEADRQIDQVIDTAQRLEAIVGAIPDLAFRIDADRRLIEVFPAAKEATRPLLPDRFLGKRVAEVLPSPLGAELEAVIERALEEQTIQVHDYEMLCNGDDLRQFEGRAVPIGGGELVWFARDVTDFRRSEAQLRASKERFRLMAETTDDVIYLRDLESKSLIYVSPSCERLFGRATATVRDDRGGWLEQIHPDDRDRVRDALGAVLERGRFDETYRIVRDNGEVRWLRDRAFLAPEADDGRCMVGAAQDITEQKKLGEELRLSQKMDAIGQLASGVAHDFRNLLMGILGCARIARERLDDPAKAREFLDEIESAAETATTITQQLLDYARRDAPTTTPEDLDAMIEEARVMLRVLLGDEIALVVRLEAGALVCIDRAELHRVLMNLAANARDAMDGGGRLIIETRRVGARPGAAGIAAVPHVLLTVTDTGAGMTESTRRRALEPFFTTKEKGRGTGLGLSAVYAIVRKAGGQIDLRSVPDGGTTVELRLPLADDKGTRVIETPRAASEGDDASCETVLLVEDNAAVRRINLYYLDQAGYRVIEASSGTEAVNLSEANDGRIDVVLTDVMLPGLSGRVVAERVVERHPDARVIFMSAYPTQWLVDEGKIPAGQKTLHKPFDRRTLLETLGREG